MSLPGFMPASSIAWIAPIAMSSLCAYSTLIFLPSAFRNASMTSLPLARVKSPVCERMILNFGSALMISSKPFLRSIAGAEPAVPCSSTMLTAPSILRVLDQPAAGRAAFLDEVRPHERDPQAVVLLGPGWGLVSTEVTGVNQKGDTAFSVTTHVFMSLAER